MNNVNLHLHRTYISTSTVKKRKFTAQPESTATKKIKKNENVYLNQIKCTASQVQKNVPLYKYLPVFKQG